VQFGRILCRTCAKTIGKKKFRLLISKIAKNLSKILSPELWYHEMVCVKQDNQHHRAQQASRSEQEQIHSKTTQTNKTTRQIAIQSNAGKKEQRERYR
jgi:hypothetical protein